MPAQGVCAGSIPHSPSFSEAARVLLRSAAKGSRAAAGGTRRIWGAAQQRASHPPEGGRPNTPLAVLAPQAPRDPTFAIPCTHPPLPTQPPHIHLERLLRAKFLAGSDVVAVAGMTRGDARRPAEAWCTEWD